MIKILLFLIGLTGFKGIYICGPDIMAYTSESTRIHEQAHRYDCQNGFISQTEEFKEEANSFPLLMDKAKRHCNGGEFCIYSEAYAMLYQHAHGEMQKIPDNFKEFYQ